MIAFDKVKEKTKDLQSSHGQRISRIRDYEDIYHMNWDFDPPEGDWVQPLPSPDPHNAVKGMVRMMIASEPSIRALSSSVDQAYQERAIEIAREMLRSQDRRGPWMLMYDLATAAILTGEAYVKVVNVEDNAKFMKDKGNKGMAKRYDRLSRIKPFIFKVYNPKSVYPEYSELGLESVTVRTERTPESLKPFWGQGAADGASMTSARESSGNKVVFWEYYDHNQRTIWVEGQDKPLQHEENVLGFIPWAGSIVEGSSLFDRPEDQRLPILYPIYASGYWHAQSYADSIMYSLALTVGKLPQLIAKLNDPNKEAKDMIDWSTPLGMIKLGLQEQIDPLSKETIDESLQIAKNIADSKITEMTVPKQIFGAPPDQQMAFAALNLLNQAGRLPMVPITRMTGVIMAQMFEIPFMWAKETGNSYEIPGAHRELVLNPGEYEDVRFEVDIQTQFAQDDQARSQVASGNVASGLWSLERGMRYTGVEAPEKERAKIEDDRERLTEHTAAVEAEAQKLAQAAMSYEGTGERIRPEEAGYRRAENAWQMCANCKFFQGPGVPCQVVEAPIDPIFTCNEFAPNDQLSSGGPTGPMGPGGGSPTGSPADPSRGGLPQAMTDPAGSTFEGATRRDRTGAPAGP